MPVNKQRRLERNRKYNKSWYERNKVKRRKQIKEKILEVVSWYEEYKKTLVCSRCGENHPACLDFHHLDPSKKDKGVGNAARQGWSKERILKEISKCDVLCSNCHRKLHYEEKLALSLNG